MWTMTRIFPLTAALILCLFLSSATQAKDASIAEPQCPNKLIIPATISPQSQAWLKKVQGPLLVMQEPITAEWAQAFRKMQYDGGRNLASKMGTVKDFQMAGVDVSVITPNGFDMSDDDRIIFYLHGGGHVIGVPVDIISVNIAAETRLKVMGVNYGMAPENPFPAGLNQSVAVYEELLKSYSPENIIFLGLSSGGGLVASTLLKAHDQGLPMPAAAVLMTPWCDLTGAGDTYAANEGRDPLLSLEFACEPAARYYAADHDPKDPLISPVYGKYFAEFPPVLITSGTMDLLLSDCARLFQNMKSSGVDTTLIVREGMWHAYEGCNAGELGSNLGVLPEGVKSFMDIGEFIDQKLGRKLP